MADEHLGRVLALIALQSVARGEADTRERRQRTEREAAERERREETRKRRATARARLGTTARREFWLVVLWSVVCAIALLVAAIALTFSPGGTGFGPALAAAWHYLWLPLAIAAGAVFLAAGAFNLYRFAGGRPPLAGGYLGDLVLLAPAVVGLFLFSASRAGSIPPSAWAAAPYAAAAGFISGLLIRVLIDQVTSAGTTRAAAVAVLAALFAAAWLTAPHSDVASAAAQREDGAVLRAAVPFEQCDRRPIAALPAGLLRNSLDAILHCHSGQIEGTVLAFRNRQLFEIYVSQKESTAGHRSGDKVEACFDRGGVYVGTWFKEERPNRELGPLICFGSGRAAKLEWADRRSNVFASITGLPRARLYRWWHRHSISPSYR